MPVELSPALPACIQAIEDELAAMACHLRSIISEPASMQDTLAEIVMIYCNVAYIFVYLEGHQSHLNFSLLMRHRAEIFGNRDQNKKMLDLLSGMSFRDPNAELVRRRWMEWFYERIQSIDSDVDRQIEDLHAAAKSLIQDVDADRTALLHRARCED